MGAHVDAKEGDSQVQLLLQGLTARSVEYTAVAESDRDSESAVVSLKEQEVEEDERILAADPNGLNQRAPAVEGLWRLSRLAGQA